MITYEYARRFVGRHVAVHCHGGRVHHGVITGVTPSHVHIHTSPYGVVSSDHNELDITTLENKTNAELQTVQWGYGYRYGFGYGGAAVTTLALYSILAISLFAW